MEIGTRMKAYEAGFKTRLMPRMPAIIRVDGKSFHSLTKKLKCKKPYDQEFADALTTSVANAMSKFSTARMAFVKSDEASILLIDYNTFMSQQSFGGVVQKLASVGASSVAAYFSLYLNTYAPFDGRVFTLPRNEVVNYFIWRQQDATRNAIQMTARTYFSHKECQNKSSNHLQEMLFQKKEINFNDMPTWFKRGRVIMSNGLVEVEPPIFSQDREYIERFMEVEQGG